MGKRPPLRLKLSNTELRGGRKIELHAAAGTCLEAGDFHFVPAVRIASVPAEVSKKARKSVQAYLNQLSHGHHPLNMKKPRLSSGGHLRLSASCASRALRQILPLPR
jgi:hypothetical protein